MGGFVKGDVVVVLFPFSDLSSAKKRPALVVSVLDGDDVILCQITSQRITDQYAIPLIDNHFSSGSLQRESNVRPNRLFTADTRIIQYRVGHLKDQAIEPVINRIIGILKK
ncbi:MAG: type II toxin-antitoxin system PemK/MazF family toxin [Methanomicrobiales archaeon]